MSIYYDGIVPQEFTRIVSPGDGRMAMPTNILTIEFIVDPSCPDFLLDNYISLPYNKFYFRLFNSYIDEVRFRFKNYIAYRNGTTIYYNSNTYGKPSSASSIAFSDDFGSSKDGAVILKTRHLEDAVGINDSKILTELPVKLLYKLKYIYNLGEKILSVYLDNEIIEERVLVDKVSIADDAYFEGAKWFNGLVDDLAYVTISDPYNTVYGYDRNNKVEAWNKNIIGDEQLILKSKEDRFVKVQILDSNGVLLKEYSLSLTANVADLTNWEPNRFNYEQGKEYKYRIFEYSPDGKTFYGSFEFTKPGAINATDAPKPTELPVIPASNFWTRLKNSQEEKLNG